MSRDYAKVLPSFWTGTTGRAIRRLGDPWCTVVATYLITSPHANAIGLYHLPIAYLCADTGSPLEGACKALRSLSEVGFCRYDEESETVWIPEMARHQIGDTLKAGDNRRVWVVKEAAAMEKRPYYAEFHAKYGEAFGIPPKPLGSPLEAPSKPLRSQEQEIEREIEQEQECESRTHAHTREDLPEAPPDVAPSARPGEALHRAYVAELARRTARHDTMTDEKLRAAILAESEVESTAKLRGVTSESLVKAALARWFDEPWAKAKGYPFLAFAKQVSQLATSSPDTHPKGIARSRSAPMEPANAFASKVHQLGGEGFAHEEV